MEHRKDERRLHKAFLHFRKNVFAVWLSGRKKMILVHSSVDVDAVQFCSWSMKPGFTVMQT